MPMSQLALDLHAVAPATLDNYVAGRNAEALQCLRRLAEGCRERRFVYLWGASGAGRSHLLRALAAGGRLLGANAAPGDLEFDAQCTLYLADDVHRMGLASQEALFHLFNRVLADPRAALVASGDAPPLALPVREDLRTRLGWGLVYELHLLSDEEKAAAVQRVAAERGVALSPDVVPWLLTHQSRDLRALLATFDALDRYAFEHKRALTLPLVREWLQHRLAP
jgi:DnaA family protein